MRLGAGAAAVALAGAPAVANADETASVDPKTGPVGYAIPAAFTLPEGTHGQPAASGVLQMVRSSTQPGVVRPSTEAPSGYPYVDSLPVTAESGSGSLFINVNNDSYLPKGAQHEDTYVVGAALKDNLVPISLIKGDFSVVADAQGADDLAVVYFDNMRSQAICKSPTETAASTQTAGIWAAQPDGSRKKISIAPGKSYTVDKLPIQPPGTLPANVEDEQVFGDVTITHVTKPAGLIKPSGFRLGDNNAVAGWRVTIEHYFMDGKKRTDLFTSSMLVGAVSCSVPDGFKPLATGDDGGQGNGDNNAGQANGDQNSSQGNGVEDADDEADVPLSIPSGGGPMDNSDGVLLGASALSVVTAGAAGVFAYRRRRADAN